MTPRVRRILTWVGYPLFYLACFIVFCYVNAPWDRVKNAVVSSFNASSPMRMEIEKLTWAWRFPGIVAKGVKLVGAAPPAPAEPGAKPKPAPEYTIDDLFARVSVFPLLWGTQKLGFSLDGFGGSVSGYSKGSSDGREMEIELDGVDAARMPYVADLLGLPVGGSMSGKIQFKVPQDKLSAAEGSVDLEINDFEIGDGKSKIRDTIALPKIRAGHFQMKAEIVEGSVKITELSTKGPDLEVVADGRIRLMDRMDASLAELNLRFKFSDAYKTKDEMTKSIFGAPDSKVPGLFDLDPQMKKAKRDDGFYAWHITGPLQHLNFVPATAGGSSSARGRKSQLRGFGKGAEGAPAPAAPAPETNE